jgi:hypothetical protein
LTSKEVWSWQGDLNSLQKNCPKGSPTRFCKIYYLSFTMEKVAIKIWDTYFLKKLPKLNNRPIGENNANLVTLLEHKM